MTNQHYTFFETGVGVCALLWRSVENETLVSGLCLPQPDERAMIVYMGKKHGPAHQAPPPASLQNTIDLVIALTEGEAVDFSAVTLDLSPFDSFSLRIYEITRAIPAGETLTYGDVAARADSPGAARAVGRAMGANLIPIIIPCHRVVASGGGMGGFSAHGGVDTKRKLLEIEGAFSADKLPLFAG